MPIYEFHCKECRQEFKTLRPAHKLPEVACNTCGSDRVVRLLSVTARTNDTQQPASCSAPTGACCMGAGGCRN